MARRAGSNVWPSGQHRLPASRRRIPVQVLFAGRAVARARSTTMNAGPSSISTSTARLGRVAILWRGDDVARRTAAPGTSRFKAVFAALADVGVDAEPVVYEIGRA